MEVFKSTTTEWDGTTLYVEGSVALIRMENEQTKTIIRAGIVINEDLVIELIDGKMVLTGGNIR